ncbi:MAG: DUF4215 domain-containing protein, partial [Pseudomonadales bacterium]
VSGRYPSIAVPFIGPAQNVGQHMPATTAYATSTRYSITRTNLLRVFPLLWYTLLLLLGISVTPLAVASTCGDGMIDYQLEQCDDGNRLAGDGCSASCSSETGNHLLPKCGNGILEGEEQCDGGSACSQQCKLNIPTNRTVDISSCGQHQSSNTVYRITKDLQSSDTCLTFQADNIVVEGQGHTIRSGGYGVYLKEWNKKNIIVRDLVIETTGASGIYGRSVNGALVSGVHVSNRATADLSLGGNVINFKESKDIVLENSLLENHVSENQNRHQFSGASVKLGSGIIRRCIFKGTPQNAVGASSDMHIFNNYGNGGTEIESNDRSVGYTNNFFIGAWNTENISINNNVVVNAGYWAKHYSIESRPLSRIIADDLPHLLQHHLSGDVTQRPLKIIQGRPQNRGLFGIDGSSPKTGIKIFNNYSSSYVPPNNEEYDGCQLGGATGIQLESIAQGSLVFNNKLVAVAAECNANAAKPSSQHDGPINIWQGNDLLAIKVERGTGSDIDAWSGMATAVALRESIPGTAFSNNRLQTMVVDKAGRQLSQVDTGGNDVSLWRLGNTAGANGFVFEGSHIDISRTPNQKYLSVAKVWSNELGNKPAQQTIAWHNTKFANAGSMQAFLAKVGQVYSGWDIAGGSDSPSLYPQITVRIDGAELGEPGTAQKKLPKAPILME